MKNLYPLLIALISLLSAQLLKPILYYIAYKEWDFKLITASGGLPSSHSAMVSSIALTVGYIEGFDSTIFSVTTAFSIIVMYDAANVRYYAGKNIELTKKLIDDLQKMDLYINKFTAPIYSEKIKTILGHKWMEVFFGSLLGAIISTISFKIINI